ncbi:MAG: fibronectin type III domain-containing protein, partial [Candidatus Muirbacterium halophilum]|nr:fibronectin type III domain-containing protein [Candidatus Muirbacterium halophilum]
MKKQTYFNILALIFFFYIIFILSSCGSSKSSAVSPVIIPQEDNDNIVDKSNNYSISGYILFDDSSEINNASKKIPQAENFRIFLYKNIEDNLHNKEILVNSNYFSISNIEYLPARIVINDFSNDIFDVDIDNSIPQNYQNNCDISLKLKFFVKYLNNQTEKQVGFLKVIKSENNILRNISSGYSESNKLKLEDFNISSYTNIININAQNIINAQKRIEKEFFTLLKYSVKDINHYLKTNMTLFPEFDLNNINTENLLNIILPDYFKLDNVNKYLPNNILDLNIKSLSSFSCTINWENDNSEVFFTIYLNDKKIKDNLKDNFILLSNLEQEKDYIFRIYSNNNFGQSKDYSEISFKTPENINSTKILKGISVNPIITKIYTLRNYDLRNLSYYAVYTDNTKEKINNITWNIFNGKGSIDNNVFNSPADTGETTIRVNYNKNNISKYSLFKIAYSEKVKILKKISLSENYASIKTTETLDLSNVYLIKEYDNQSVDNTIYFNFYIKSGEGNLNDKVFTPEAIAQTVVLGVDIEDDGNIFSTEYEISIRKSLSSIELIPNQTTLNVNQVFDLELIKVIASYDEITTDEVNINTWTMASGPGFIDGSIFYSPDIVSISTVKGVYTEDSVEKSAYFTIYTGKTLQRIVLSENNVLLPVETSFNMNNILITAEYDDNSSKTIQNIIWNKISGRGILENNIFSTQNNEGEALLRVEYEDEGKTVQADLIITIKFKPSIPTGLSVVETNKNSVKLIWNSNVTDNQYNVYKDGILVLQGLSEPNCYITGLESGKEYVFNVTSINVTGESLLSQPITARTKPEPVLNIYTDSLTSKTINIHWDIVLGVSNYRIFLNSREIDPINSDNFYLFKNLIPGTTYNIQIQSENSSGKGDISANYAVSTLLSPPQNINITEIG